MAETSEQFVVDAERHTVRTHQLWRIPGGIRALVVAGDLTDKAWGVFCPTRENYL